MNQRIDDEGEKRDVEQDENRIDCLNLRRQPSHAHEIKVHVFCLQHPRRTSLIIQSPEQGDEDEKRPQLGERDETFARKQFMKKLEATCGNVDEFFSA